jgi:hypothetical protein
MLALVTFSLVPRGLCRKCPHSVTARGFLHGNIVCPVSDPSGQLGRVVGVARPGGGTVAGLAVAGRPAGLSHRIAVASDQGQ